MKQISLYLHTEQELKALEVLKDHSIDIQDVLRKHLINFSQHIEELDNK